MINEKVMQALSGVGVPVHFRRYTGKKDQYITFFEYFSNSQLDADDEGKINGHFVQVDIWSKSDYANLMDMAKKEMRKAGFIWKSDGPDLYEEDSGLFHKPMRFFYYEEVER